MKVCNDNVTKNLKTQITRLPSYLESILALIKISNCGSLIYVVIHSFRAKISGLVEN